jgi:hypothetical protein
VIPDGGAASGREPFDPAEVPRRDVVPPSGFSLPSDVTSDPEATALVPEFRRKRRRIALGVTAALVMGVSLLAIRLAYWTWGAPVEDRWGGMLPYTFLLFCGVGASLGVWAAWKWAMAPDPSERLRRI